jgi:hypothetical protein
MRALFPGYVRRSEPDFSSMWKTCVFSFDANFLLDLYRSTPRVRETLLRTLENLGDRIWLTNQSALEYYRNRESVISESSKSYDDVSGLVRDAARSVESKLKQYQKHVNIEVEKVVEIIKKASDEVEGLLKKLRSAHPDYSKRDGIEEKLSQLFEGKVGPPYSPEALEAILQQAAKRFADRVPPGYKDEHQKDGRRKFGDVILWFQLLEMAREKNKPVIFVTADSKEDWWTSEGKPRPELIQEMFSEASSVFHMYKPAQFVTYAGKLLGSQKEAESIKKAASELRMIESQRAATAAVRDAVYGLSPSAPSSEAFRRLLEAVGPEKSSVAAATAYLSSLMEPRPLSAAVSAYLASIGAGFKPSEFDRYMANLTWRQHALDLDKYTSVLSRDFAGFGTSSSSVGEKRAEPGEAASPPGTQPASAERGSQNNDTARDENAPTGKASP